MINQTAPQGERAAAQRPRVIHFSLPDREDGMIHALCGFTFPKAKAIYPQDMAGSERPTVDCPRCQSMFQLEKGLRK